MAFQPISQGPFLKGLVASNQPLSQPKGSFPRGSNLVLMERGALTPCDGSGIINNFLGAVGVGQGRMMCEFLFAPTGVPSYHMVVMKGNAAQLGAPHAVSATPSTGGSLTNGTQYFYKITALDGEGGETTASNEITGTPSGGNLSNTLIWNVVPNAFGYNVYRSTVTGMEILLTGGDATHALPQIQPNPLTGTVTYIDNGSAAVFPGGGLAITNINTPTDFNNFAYVNLAAPASLYLGQILTVTGNSISAWNTIVTVSVIFSPTSYRIDAPVFGLYPNATVGTGGSLTSGATPPVADTTQQTVLVRMPLGIIPVAFGPANFVAYFPRSLAALGAVPTGGTGGSGGTGPGISGQGSSTPSGGVAGLVGPLPQMKQFTNRVIIALGNGFAPQMYSDASGTPVNPAFTGAITSVAVSGDEVTLTTSAVLTAQNLPVGSNVILAMSDVTYSGVFVVISVNTGAGTFVVRNLSASGGASTGTFTVSTTPIISTFTPAYPVWTASSAYAVGDIIVPLTQPTPNIYLTATQAGVSGTVEPTWDSNIGDQFSDGSVLWTVTALLNSAAPPPPGAGHIEVYAGSLWVLNSSPTNTANGLDGPCALRMSNTNNPNAWNPVNQAFLDKDDGAEGMGLGKFTITAQGIPPEGSLIAFKYRVPYQIIGVFGANNFAIQPVSSDMGCLAPRSITFVPGYGLMRYSHLGIAVFNGFRDEVISEQIRPYLFPVNDFDARDIVVADANYLPLSWAAQTANPPMYAFAMPIGNSNGQLTRMMAYDLVLKAWAAPVDLPFAIGCMAQVQPVTSNPLTILGGFSDGCLQRWQAGDIKWYTGDIIANQEVAWSLRTVTVASQNSSQRLWARKMIVRGTGSNSDTDPFSIINVQIRQSGVVKSSVNYKISNQGDFDLFADIGLTGLRFDAIISGDDHLEIDGIDFAVEPRPFGVPVSAV
jgi:hypothetical protein